MKRRYKQIQHIEQIRPRYYEDSRCRDAEHQEEELYKLLREFDEQSPYRTFVACFDNAKITDIHKSEIKGFETGEFDEETLARLDDLVEIGETFNWIEVCRVNEQCENHIKYSDYTMCHSAKGRRIQREK